ncbi:hypothetical protein JCM3774_002245 [Rhodotorula dairenensis]
MHTARSLVAPRPPPQPDIQQQTMQATDYRSRSAYSALPPPNRADAPPSLSSSYGSAYPPFASTSTMQAYLPATHPPASLAYATSSIPTQGGSHGNVSSYRQSGPPVQQPQPSYLSYPGSVLPAPPPFVAPREPAPLFDSTESELLSSFLTTLDVDPNFLFNPVLPPGMPSPPEDPALATYGMDARDRWERELRQQYGAHFEGQRGGNGIGSGVKRIPDLPSSGDDDDADAPDDVPVKDETDDDPDFQPKTRRGGGSSNGRGGKKKATGGRGGAAAAAADRGVTKKPRASAARQQRQPVVAEEEDVDMTAGADRAASAPGLTASGRPKRNARPPRRLSGSGATGGPVAPAGPSATPSSSSAPASAARAASRPSLVQTTVPPSLPALPVEAHESFQHSQHAFSPSHQQQHRLLAHPHSSHAGAVPPPHGADFGLMSGPLSPGLDELPEPPASSYTELPSAGLKSDLSNGPPPRPRGGDEASPSSSTATPTGGGVGGGGAGRAAPLTDSQKRSNHILSEQKRRNAIRSGFKDLVDFLVAGEAASGIILGPPGSGSASDQSLQQQQQQAAAQAQAEEEAANGKKRKGKGTGRGRGRRGDAGANASKSVVLTRAADYILWLERGNRALENEIERLEAA